MDKLKEILANIKSFYTNNKRLTISLSSILIVALIMIPIINSINKNEDTTETVSPITISYETDVVNTNGEFNNLELLHTFIEQVNNNEPALIRYVTDIDGKLNAVNLDYDGQFIKANRDNKCTFEDVEHNNPCVYEDRLAWKKEDGLINYYLVSGDDLEKILSVDLSITSNKDFYNSLYTIDYNKDVIITDNGQDIKNLDSLRTFLRSTNTYKENELNIVEITETGIVEVTTLHFDGRNIHVNNHMTSNDQINCHSVPDSESTSCIFNSNSLNISDDKIVYTLLNRYQSEVIVNIDLSKSEETTADAIAD
ncbi:hypothetical protein [Haloplasma contractile]|uniref:Uncharacterized protein n=1 Tax=Haloplasma contractile SSD-17B TaxID=1033810 RepID=U2FEY0_9MOLU|nr:hypothetical protein [Haloplasma contractile]ERJ11490.1 hypothetical protein HLPCO_002402 [Haloplasma contractile SSD-17B]